MILTILLSTCSCKMKAKLDPRFRRKVSLLDVSPCCKNATGLFSGEDKLRDVHYVGVRFVFIAL